MAKLTKTEERRRRKLASRLASAPEGTIEQVPRVRVAWARRRLVERLSDRRHYGPSSSEPIELFELWVEHAPGEPPRQPDETAYTPEAAVLTWPDTREWIKASC